MNAIIERLNLKEMCAAFAVTPRTLRYYEYIELLSPEKQGRNRFYGAREQARMKLIMRGRKFGFSLEDIRRWLLLYDQEGIEAQLRKWYEAADSQLAALEERRKQLESTIRELRTLRNRSQTMLKP
ncbi:MerR family transcriptional regulator [Ketogulonicigenium vulgare]|uniref:Transcriptional regulator, putative n=1 Tax=Ketogulonicigenium vulgare (strain WSH-001) TaxID=759362 RepID=F9YAM5_KETVW|nr:MerR family DNA-binding transcriptional regulator [Ketogulonicigenium vulgare]ADO43263.1 transcriptional regulator, putative [Ketogulonicigenium vulgare Y25]AEM41556.1 Transcriptional regulator, putative [Ketogulonicigenium vulgare WSH-001]ALJ81675.1 MerR family transcriptional regulator [Ketogulonicigenium vulgare]ANW34345.1 MerR family transcriptional regulator [Ketogulonicigenium vulgare]AOZ55300.1 transcriptional regulator [Ketogulonicigenium vulgare]